MGGRAGSELFTRRKPGSGLFAFYEQIQSQSRNPGDILLQCKPYRRAGMKKELVSEIAEYKLKRYTLHENAIRLSKALQSGSDRYPELTEMTQKGILPGITTLHTLRSFAWTAGDYKKRIGMDLDNLSEKELAAVVEFVTETGYLNYRGGSFFPGLCSFPDRDVLFVSELQIRKGTQRYKEFAYTASLNRLQKDLIRLKPVMEGIAVALFAGVVGEEDRKVFSGVLAAWCALAVAAKEPFLLLEGPKQYRKKTASKKSAERALPQEEPGKGGEIPEEAVFEAANYEIISKRLIELQEDDMVANNDPGRERTVEELIAELMGSAAAPKEPAPAPAPAPAPVEPEWEVTSNEPKNDIEPEWEVSYVTPTASAPEIPIAPAPAPAPEPVAPAPAPVPEPVAPAPVIPDPNYVPPEPSYYFNQSILDSITPAQVVEPAPAPAPEPVAPAPEPAPAAAEQDPIYFFNQSILEQVQPAGIVVEPAPAPAPEPVVEAVPEPAPVVPEPVAAPEPAPAPAPAPAKPVSTIPNIAPAGTAPAAATYETNEASQEEIDEHEAAVRRRMREILEQNKRKQQEKDEVRRQMEERRLEVARRQEQRRQEILAKRKADYERLCNEQEELRRIVEENKTALMGERKRKRIEAQQRITDIEDIILKEYLDLKRGTNDYHTGLTQEL